LALTWLPGLARHVIIMTLGMIGGRSKASPVKSVGLFHELPLELQDSLVVMSKRNAPESRQKFRESL
jgi:hypothetical protein